MFKSLKGMPDLLPDQISQWQAMENHLKHLLQLAGYKEIRTPFLESADLFAHSIGATSDIVEKEMFVFHDQGGNVMALRPEGTASVVRAFLEHHLDHGNPLLKLFYLGPMFRYERPQKGRFRQFYQVGVEVLGSESPMVDAEVMMLLYQICTSVGVESISLEINSLGDSTCRPIYREKLKSFLMSHQHQLCETCQRRSEVNPLRVFDCKSEACQAALVQAPVLLEDLCVPCKKHLETIQQYLRLCEIPFCLNPKIVRGLDYYSRTAFELTGKGLGSQNAIGAGGRYDGLSEMLGGPRTPGIGFALGLERLIAAAQHIPGIKPLRRIVFIPLEEKANELILRWIQGIREKLQYTESSIQVEVDLMTDCQSMKSALRNADRQKASIVVLIGERELSTHTATIKNLVTHEQHNIAFAEIASKLLQQIYE